MLATAHFTDVVQSTEQLAAVGDRAWDGLLSLHDLICMRVINRNLGRCSLAIAESSAREMAARTFDRAQVPRA
jgi:hypothetical protein